MVDFKLLLSKPMDQIKKPPLLPDGLYLAVIKNRKYEMTKPSNDAPEGNPFVRFDIELTAPGEGHDPDAFLGDGGKPIEVAGKKMRKDYFFTEKAEWRFLEAAKSMGIEPGPNIDIAAAVEMMNNQPCLVLVGRRPMQGKQQPGSSEPPEFINEIVDIKGRA